MSTNPPIPTSISSSSSSEPVGISADPSHPSQSNSMKGVDPTLNQSIHTPSTHHPTQSSYTNTDSRGSQVHTLIDSNHTPSVELINSSSPLTPSANSNSILPISAKSFLLNHSNANSNNSISSISSSSSSSSLTVDPTKLTFLDELLPSSSSTSTSTQIQHMNTFMSDPSPPSTLAQIVNHVAASSPSPLAATTSESVVAPYSEQSTNAITPSTRGDQRDEHTPSTSNTSTHANANDGGPTPSIPTPTSPTVSQPSFTPSQALLAKLAEAFQASKRSTSTSTLTSSSTYGANKIDIQCYCLVVDPSHLAPTSTDYQQYKAALSIGTASGNITTHNIQTQHVPTSSSSSSSSTSSSVRRLTPLHQHCLTWLGDRIQSPDDISTVYIDQQLLHINFINYESLGRALALIPFLVRCGTNGMAWNGKPCGPHRSHLPECIRITCVPTLNNQESDLDKAAKELLLNMKVDYTAVWYPSSNHRVFQSQSSRVRKQITICFLPRNIQLTDLSSMIDRLHLKYDLWGGKLRFHAPNTPSLNRCTQCDQLGHSSDKCELYKGLAIRLVMKDPISYHAMKQMINLVECRIGYLGSGVGDAKPSRRVTLLFNIEDDETIPKLDQVNSIYQRFIPIFQQYQLHSPPTTVDTSLRSRTRECKECGSTEKEHQCPFNTNNIMFGSTTTATAATSASAPTSSPSTANNTGSGTSGSMMCHGWRRHKRCSRHERQQCKYDHPDDYMPSNDICFSYRDRGHCPRGSLCRYSHQEQALPQPQQQQSNMSNGGDVTASTAASGTNSNVSNQSQLVRSAPHAAVMQSSNTANVNSKTNDTNQSNDPPLSSVLTTMSSQIAPHGLPPSNKSRPSTSKGKRSRETEVVEESKSEDQQEEEEISMDDHRPSDDDIHNANGSNTNSMSTNAAATAAVAVTTTVRKKPRQSPSSNNRSTQAMRVAVPIPMRMEWAEASDDDSALTPTPVPSTPTRNPPRANSYPIGTILPSSLSKLASPSKVRSNSIRASKHVKSPHTNRFSALDTDDEDH